MNLPFPSLRLSNLRHNGGCSEDIETPISTKSDEEGPMALFEASPRLFFGDYNFACDLRLLKIHNIDIIVNLTSGLPNKFEKIVKYENFALEDTPEDKFDDNLINLLTRLNGFISSGMRVLVHCRKGISRAPAIVLGFLIRYRHCSFEEAFNHLRELDPKIDPNIGFIFQLQKLESLSPLNQIEYQLIIRHNT